MTNDSGPHAHCLRGRVPVTALYGSSSPASRHPCRIAHVIHPARNAAPASARECRMGTFQMSERLGTGNGRINTDRSRVVKFAVRARPTRFHPDLSKKSTMKSFNFVLAAIALLAPAAFANHERVRPIDRQMARRARHRSERQWLADLGRALSDETGRQHLWHGQEKRHRVSARIERRRAGHTGHL